jgi:hypothetical protein
MRLRTLLGSIATLLVVVSPASAKWTIGNGATDLDINPADPAVPGQVCTDHITGRVGESTSQDPAVTAPPAGPYSPVKVFVYTGPPGSLDGSVNDPQGIRTPDGSVLTPIFTAEVTPVPLVPAEPYADFNGNKYWEYAAAQLDMTLPPLAIPAGNEVLIQRSGRSAYLTVAAVACTPPPPIAATIDVLPGISPNVVVPSLTQPALLVRVFGSAALDVSAIATVKLGAAAAAPIPASLARYFVPKDRNGDGRLDRDYLFVPAATGITCSSSTVSLTGTLTGGGTFAGSDAVRPILCKP